MISANRDAKATAIDAERVGLDPVSRIVSVSHLRLNETFETVQERSLKILIYFDIFVFLSSSLCYIVRCSNYIIENV